MNEIMRTVVEIARRHAAPQASAVLQDPDVDLSKEGFDSLVMVGFILDLEKRFSIRFPSHVLSVANFRSLRAIADCIGTIRAERGQ